jgi:hemolysin III
MTQSKKIIWYPDKETIAQNKAEYKKFQLVYYTPIEELLNALTHALGIIAAFIGFGFMLHYSSNPSQYVASVIVFLGFFALFTNSTAYHATYKIPVKKYLRVFDHATVNTLVFACGVTACLCTSNHPFNYVAVGISCAVIILSYILSLISLKKFSVFIFFNNFIIGFMLLAVYIINLEYIPKIVSHISLAGVILCVTGSIVYTIKKPFIHTIFHIFVLIGPLCFLAAQILFIKYVA